MSKKNSVKYGNSKAALTVMVIFLALYSLILIYMYLWGIISSLKSYADYEVNKFWLPEGHIWEWRWDNYSRTLESMIMTVVQWNGGNGIPVMFDFFGELGNSFLYAVGSSLVTLAVTWVVAYCLSRYRWRFSKFIYTLNMVFMIIPIVGSLPSALQTYRAIGLYDNWAYIFVSSINFVGVNLLIFYSFLNGIGREYTDSAYIDGASDFTVMTRIVFPLSSQMFLILFIMLFVQKWNDYMTMLIWMPGHPTVAYGVYTVSFSAQLPPVKMAACVVLMVPIIIVFLFFQDKMMGNLRMGALKG